MNECKCDNCETEQHGSDCAVHNEPATPNGDCDCKDEWISVADRLPDGSAMVLVWVSAERSSSIDGQCGSTADVSEIDFGSRRDGVDGPYMDNYMGQIGDQQDVTHWQPLPSPPVN